MEKAIKRSTLQGKREKIFLMGASRSPVEGTARVIETRQSAPLILNPIAQKKFLNLVVGCFEFKTAHYPQF